MKSPSLLVATAAKCLLIFGRSVAGDTTGDPAPPSCTFINDIHAYTVGDQPRSVVAEDLDGDFDTDLVVANYADGAGSDVSVLLNNGDGTFIGQVRYSTGEGPVYIAPADLDADLDVDLVVANHAEGSSDVSVLLNDGDGTFAPEMRYLAGERPSLIVTADLDGDLDVDLVVRNLQSTDFSILLNNGNGTFAPEVRYDAVNPVNIAVDDLDGDGDLDLALADFAGMSIAVHLNHGDGTLGDAVEYPTGGYTGLGPVGDFDDDGDLDLAVGVSGDLLLLLNQGDGTFAFGDFYRLPGGSPGASGDLDSDGDLDLVSGSSILLNQGDGTFVLHPDDLPPGNVVLGDLDGDSDLDIVRSRPTDREVAILLNAGDATFAINYYGTGYSPLDPEDATRPPVLADVTGDLAPDLVWPERNESWVWVLRNEGDGAFESDVHYDTGTFAYSLTAGDLDGDLDQDVVVAGGSGLALFFNEGDGSFPPPVLAVPASEGRDIVAGDLDGDSDLDLALAHRPLDEVWVLLNPGDGSFGSPLRYDVGDAPDSLASGDLDGDGDLDLVAGSVTTVEVSVLLNKGDGTFLPEMRHAVGDEQSVVALADLDGDTAPDLVTGLIDDRGIGVFLNDGDGTFGGMFGFYDTGSAVRSITLAELNGLPGLDVAAGVAFDMVYVFHNDGDGTFSPPLIYQVFNDPDAIAAGDVDRDDDVDLVTANRTTYEVAVFLNNGDGTFAPHVDYAAGIDPVDLTLTDLDGDVDLDLVVAWQDRISVRQNSCTLDLCVPDCIATLTEAIELAHDGDTILVEPGVYDERIDFGGKSIAIRSTGGPEVTIINGGGMGSVVTASRGEGPGSMLEGFMIVGGQAEAGGGFYLVGSSPVIRDCIIMLNAASLRGGGAYVEDGAPRFDECRFEVNESAGAGGGLAALMGEPALVRCTFLGNSAAGPGGGLNLVGDPEAWITPVLVNCRILQNDALRGGGVAQSYARTELTNCLLAGNTVTAQGGAIAVHESSPVLTNATMVANTADDGHVNGIDIAGPLSEPVIRNAILWWNGGSAEQDQIGVRQGALEENIDISWSCVHGWTGRYGGPGMIAANPDFVDAGGGNGDPTTVDDNDYRLSAGSPCIDAGDSGAVAADAFDLDEDGDPDEPVPLDLGDQPRFRDDIGSDDTGMADPPRTDVVVDMGAYEFQGQTIAGDVDGDGLVGFSDLLFVLNSWGPCPAPPFSCPGDFDHNGSIGFGDLITVINGWG